MAGSFYGNNSDSMDISELAKLNEDISDDLLDKLQSQLSTEAATFADNNSNVDTNDDATLFEETSGNVKNNITEEGLQSESVNNETIQNTKPVSNQAETEKKEEINVNKNFDDNFIKKYKAKLSKKAQSLTQEKTEDDTTNEPVNEEQQIETLSQGNISERPLTQELKDYNDSLDFLDGNVKYSKYVIYIDPQNVDFIDGLTVKERKNLINGILRQQDDIAITKQRFKIIQTVIRHVIVAIITISVAIPVVYMAINTSLEATIENHRRSQSNWQVLYKEHGKITKN